MKKILLLLIISCNAFSMDSDGNITLQLKDAIITKATNQTPAIIKKVLVTIPKNESWKIGEMPTVLEKELWRKRLGVKKPSYCSDVSQSEFELCCNALEIMPGESFTKYFNGLSEDDKADLINGAGKLGIMNLTYQLMETKFSKDIIIAYFEKCLTEPVIDYCFSKNLSQLNISIEEENIPELSQLKIGNENFDWRHTKLSITNPTTNIKYYYKLENKKIINNTPYIIVTDYDNENNTHLFFTFNQDKWAREGLPIGTYNNFSHNGKYLAATNETNNQVIIRKLGIKDDYSDFFIIYEIPIAGKVKELLFCPDNKHLCIVSSNDQGGVYVEMWNINTWEKAYSKKWLNIIERIIFTPSGDKLIIISDYFHCTILDPVTGSIMFTMQDGWCSEIQEKNEEHITPPTLLIYNHSIAFNYNEKYCIIGAILDIDNQLNTIISIFDLHTGTYLVSIDINNTKLFSLSLAPTMQYIPFYVDVSENENIFQNNATLKFKLYYLKLYNTEHAHGFNKIKDNTTLLEKYALYRFYRAAQNEQNYLDLTQGPTYHALQSLSKTSCNYFLKNYFPRYQSYYNENKDIISTQYNKIISKIQDTWNDFFHSS